MSKLPYAALMLLAATLASAQPDFSAVVRRVQPSVVFIVADKIEPRPGMNSPDAPLVEVPALGSGFVIDTLGHIVTCNHVIANYEKLSVKFSDGSVVSGTDVVVTGRDPVTDLAVIRVKAGRKFVPARLGNSDDLLVGQPVLALGSPFGLEGSASAGIVSGLSRWGLAKQSGPDFQDYIQTDALVNPGNSGGPLVDSDGRVVGVCSFARTTRAGPTGIGFCTTVNTVREVAAQLVRNGHVIRGYLGTSTQPITEGIRLALGLPTKQGILVTAVVPAGPASLAGLRPGDAILTLDGQPVTDVRAFQADVAGRAPGASVKLGIVRRGARNNVAMVLSMWPVAGAEPRPALPVKQWLGLAAVVLPDSMRSRSGADYGFLVAGVEPGGPAYSAGIRQGDVVNEVNLAPVRTVADFEKIRGVMAGTATPMLFRVLRGRQPFYTAIEP
jgi:serine protease Do